MNPPPNAALLLNPKAARKDDQSNRNNERVVPRMQQPYDPRALLNPGPYAKRAASEGMGGRSEDGGSPGQMSFVERMYNLQERTEPPAKRQRVDNDPRTKAKSHGHGSGSSGLLNTDRTQNGQAKTTGPPQGNAIDLTLSDDDQELIVVKDNSNQEICIGKIHQAYIQCHMIPHPNPTKYLGNAHATGRIDVHFRRTETRASGNTIMCVDPTKREFGRIDLKTANAVVPLMSGAANTGLRWKAMTDPRRRRPEEGPPGSEFHALISVSIQLYCPRKHAKDIGRYLKNHNVELVDPVFYRDKFPYWNPQKPDAAISQAVEPGSEGGGGRGRGDYVPMGAYVMRTVEEVRSDIDHIFTHIINSDVSEREQSGSIITPLLPHQKQALQFMWKHEQEATIDDSNRHLYRLKDKNNGGTYYYNVITGEELRGKPAHCLGGILADEMGLGKTLSILSLVVDDESRAAAQAFALKAPPIKGPGGLIKNSRATLLICPLSTMFNWDSQNMEHLKPNTLKVLHYHGGERAKLTLNDIADYDLVITTYQTVGTESSRKGAKGSALFQIKWFRIVLDEAHTIRNQQAKQSQAICALAAQRRWAVTGTPVQNRLEDLGALFKFLQLKPFDTTQAFNSFILMPFKNADPDVVTKLQLLVSTVTLRRVKEGVVNLPKRTDQVVKLRFSKEEQILHDWFEQDSARKVNAVTSGEKLGGHAYARILTAILNLRLICAHGRELLSDEALKTTEGISYDNPVELGDEEEVQTLTRNQAYDMLEALSAVDNDVCQNCQRRITTPAGSEDDSDEDDDLLGYMTVCYHIICLKCVKPLQAQWQQDVEADGRVICNFCDERVGTSLFELRAEEWDEYTEERQRLRQDPKLAKKLGKYHGPHTKTKALLEELRRDDEESRRLPEGEPPIKSVVFSTWTSHLDLIEIALTAAGHNFTRLDGRMSRPKREHALHTFINDPSTTIILVSIQAGGLGLNLTAANKAYVMEPQYNPAAEAQAVDRVHRMGQKREVVITRFIMEGSFEEKMLDLQRKKIALAQLTMERKSKGGGKEALAKQRLEELRSLFR